MPNAPCPRCGEPLTEPEVRSLNGRINSALAGDKPGRPPKLTKRQQAAALKRLEAGETCRAVAERFGVHPTTIWRMKRA